MCFEDIVVRLDICPQTLVLNANMVEPGCFLPKIHFISNQNSEMKLYMINDELFVCAVSTVDMSQPL